MAAKVAVLRYNQRLEVQNPVTGEVLLVRRDDDPIYRTETTRKKTRKERIDARNRREAETRRYREERRRFRRSVAKAEDRRRAYLRDSYTRG